LPSQVLSRIWGSIGGYIGFVPVVIALAGLFIPQRRAVKVFLLGWVVVALGVTQGLPGIYQAFMALPLTKATVCFRYLNASWIFCIIFLAALFIDSIPTLPQPALRRILCWAVVSGLILIAAAAVGARPLIADLWTNFPASRTFIAGALLCVAVLSFCIPGAGRCAGARWAATALSCILVAEAMLWFTIPYLAYPRQGKVDNDVIAFLQANFGYQRVVDASRGGLLPDYGSYFGIPLLNYEDNPIPKRTVDYIKENLDPYADPIIFVPWSGDFSPEQQADRQKIFWERLSRYARTGVKYVLAGPGFNSNPAFHFLPGGNYPYALAAGQRIEISGQREPDNLSPVTAVSLMVATYGDISSGHLKVTLCAQSSCAEGLADLGRAIDNGPLVIALDRPVEVEAGKGYTIRIEKLDGDKDVAIWMYPLASTDTAAKIVGAPVPVRDNYLPYLRFMFGSDLKPVFLSRSMIVYAMPDTRDYFSADACELRPVSHDRVDASCARSSKLDRLEIYMRGWSATVNGKTVPVGLSEDGTFQTVDLPAGASRIEFQYEPLGFKWALAAACAALLLVFAVFARAIRVAMRSARSSPGHPG
jgi:hypothetical protein